MDHKGGEKKKKKAARALETEQKMESKKTRNFQGDRFNERLALAALFNRSGPTRCTLKQQMKEE